MIKSAAQHEDLFGWMDTLADPTRLRLMRLLESHELGVAELCDVLQMPQSTVSRHLKHLSDQGWTQCRRQGTTNLYRSVIDELVPPARRLWLLAREQTDGWPAVDQDQLRLTQRLKQRQEDSQAFFASAAQEWDKLREQRLARMKQLGNVLLAGMQRPVSRKRLTIPTTTSPTRSATKLSA